jgi:predicted membrane protein
MVFIVCFPLVAAITLGLTLAIVLLLFNQKFCERFSPTKSAALTTILGFIVIGFTLALVVNLLIKGSGSIFAPRFWTIFSEFLHNKVVEKIPN